MKLAYIYEDHHDAGKIWSQNKFKTWLLSVFEAPTVRIGPRCTSKIRKHVEQEFLSEGWALDVQLNQEHRLTVFSMLDRLSFHLQTGNMSRAPYDLLKFQYLFQCGRIEAAALALPTKHAAGLIGDNIANADRVIKELKLFENVITVPILVVVFE